MPFIVRGRPLRGKWRTALCLALPVKDEYQTYSRQVKVTKTEAFLCMLIDLIDLIVIFKCWLFSSPSFCSPSSYGSVLPAGEHDFVLLFSYIYLFYIYFFADDYVLSAPFCVCDCTCVFCSLCFVMYSSSALYSQTQTAE